MKYKPGKRAPAVENLISLILLLLISRDILEFLQHCVLRDEAESCALPYSVSQGEQNFLSALSFIIPFQNPLLLCYAPAEILFIAIKKATEVAIILFFF